MRKIILWGASAFFFLAAGTGAWAGYEYTYDARLSPFGNYESEMAGKLSRGATNLVYGWTELVQTPVAIGQEERHNFFKAAAVGIPYGIGRFVARTLVGTYEIVTFYAPQRPIMRPIEGMVQ